MTIEEWGVVVGLTATLAGLIIKFYTEVNVRLKSLEIELRQLQDNESKNENKFNQIMEKLQDILVKLENKANR